MLVYLYESNYDDQDWSTMEQVNDYTIMRPEAGVQLVDEFEEEESVEAQNSPTQQDEYFEGETDGDQSQLTATHFRMLNDICVYALAEEYNISALKVLAKHKF